MPAQRALAIVLLPVVLLGAVVIGLVLRHQHEDGPDTVVKHYINALSTDFSVDLTAAKLTLLTD